MLCHIELQYCNKDTYMCYMQNSRGTNTGSVYNSSSARQPVQYQSTSTVGGGTAMPKPLAVVLALAPSPSPSPRGPGDEATISLAVSCLY